MNDYDIENESFTLLKLSYDIMFTFEISNSLIDPLLPTGLRSLEIRPNITLLTCGTQQIVANNIESSFSGVIDEVNINAVVQPDLSVNMPQPKFSCYPLYSISSCNEYLHYIYNTYKIPCYHLPSLQVISNNDGNNVEIKDDDGAILTLKNTFSSPMQFKREMLYFQTFTKLNDRKGYLIPCSWEGEAFEHQQKGDAGKLHNHPILKDLNLPSDDMKCYSQMLGPRNQENTKLKYYTPIEYPY